MYDVGVDCRSQSDGNHSRNIKMASLAFVTPGNSVQPHVLTRLACPVTKLGAAAALQVQSCQQTVFDKAVPIVKPPVVIWQGRTGMVRR